MARLLKSLTILLLSSLAVACGRTTDTSDQEGAGGQVSSGGTPASGGATPLGGRDAAGGSPSGGAGGTASGGAAGCLSDSLNLPDPVTVRFAGGPMAEAIGGPLPTFGIYDLVDWIAYDGSSALEGDSRSAAFEFLPDNLVAVANDSGYRVTFENILPDADIQYLTLLGVCPDTKNPKKPEQSAYEMVAAYTMVDGDFQHHTDFGIMVYRLRIK